MINYKRYYLTITLILFSILTYSQCDDLKGNNDGMANWKEKYYSYFHADSTTYLIKADSVLIYYFSNTENETNYGMSCSFYKADKYAQIELVDNIEILKNKLDKEDSVNFIKAQQFWQLYYDSEWEFLRNAFIAYSNYTKYGQGREIMIETASRKYQIIKDRIVTIKTYITNSTTE